MPGIHGDMLAYWPELLLDYTIWRMKPELGAGYKAREVYKVIEGAYFSRNKGGDQTVISELKTENQKAAFWSPDEIPRGDIVQGLYLEDDGELYTFINDNAYVREGGFVRYRVQLVVGSTDKQAPNPKVNLGKDQFS